MSRSEFPDPGLLRTFGEPEIAVGPALLGIGRAVATILGDGARQRIRNITDATPKAHETASRSSLCEYDALSMEHRCGGRHIHRHHGVCDRCAGTAKKAIGIAPSRAKRQVARLSLCDLRVERDSQPASARHGAD